jgi:predicted alpha/beta hydrolase family esterase
VTQRDWTRAEVDHWSDRVSDTVTRYPGTRWVAVTHSFGCLAVARHLARGGKGIEAALFVLPADPDKFGVANLLPASRLAVPSVLVGSDNDPWMRADQARAWARRWGSQFVHLGAAGHINTESGFGPLPQAKTLTELLIHRVQRNRRLDHAHALELSFAI